MVDLPFCLLRVSVGVVPAVFHDGIYLPLLCRFGGWMGETSGDLISDCPGVVWIQIMGIGV